jgi:validoxylamine A glucosyltransferase
MEIAEKLAGTAADGAPGAPRVSVIIPTYNRADMLRATLESLTRQSLPVSEYEVVVSDDGSSDTTRAVVESFRDRLHLKYHFQEDLGFRAAHARNAGAGLAEAPILIFLDCGTLAGPGFVEAHERLHAPDGGPGRAVAGYVHGYPPLGNDAADFTPLPDLAEAVAGLRPEQVVERFRDEEAFRDGRHAELEKIGFDLSRRTVPEEMFSTANCSVTAGDFRAVGGFNEMFRSWGLEDMELAYRLVRHGCRFVIALDAWAVETPHERDNMGNLTSLLGNVQLMLDAYAFREPLLEMVWLVIMSGTPVMASLEILNRKRLDAAAQAGSIEVGELVAEQFAQAPEGARIVVLGAGSSVPGGAPPSAVLADFDPLAVEALRACADGREVLYNIGVRTALPDGAVDLVVITPRLGPLWEDFGAQVLAEARRIGAQVRCLVPGAQAESDGATAVEVAGH